MNEQRKRSEQKKKHRIGERQECRMCEHRPNEREKCSAKKTKMLKKRSGVNQCENDDMPSNANHSQTHTHTRVLCFDVMFTVHYGLEIRDDVIGIGGNTSVCIRFSFFFLFSFRNIFFFIQIFAFIRTKCVIARIAVVAGHVCVCAFARSIA